MDNNRRLKALIKEVSDQENRLVFDSFSNELAWQIGSILVEKALKNQLPVTIDITRNRQQLFHYACTGTNADNDYWIKRKNNVVYRFFHSSLYMSYMLQKDETTIEERYLLKESEYAPHGGAFPIIVKDTGVIGTITVSGLASEEDHQMVVDAITAVINQ